LHRQIVADSLKRTRCISPTSPTNLPILRARRHAGPQYSKSHNLGSSVMTQKKERALDPQTILAKINGGKSESKYKRDQIVFPQGDPADYVFYLQTGRVKVTVVSEDGKEAVVAILQPGSFFGEECLTGHRLRMATVTALSECLLIRMPKKSIIQALHDDPDFSALFTTYLMERNIRVQEDLVDTLLNSTEKRLARLLLILANYGKEDRPDPIVPKINQETLADMIGTSRTHVNSFMNKFRQLGFIEYNGDAKGGIKVHRSLLNMLLHETPQIASQD
jgi:CRP/FNR family cyclic AMP-dependent transcriptional regulator